MKYIKQKRIQIGLTQADMALRLGVDKSTVTKWETGVAAPRIQLLPKLAEVLNCTIDDLFREERGQTG